MKDKLSKNGHKGMYYFIRRFFLGVVISASVVAAVGIPTYIVIKHNVDKQTIAQGDDNDDTMDTISYNDGSDQ